MNILKLILDNAVAEMPKGIGNNDNIKYLEKEFQMLIKKIPYNDLANEIEEVNSRYLTEIYEIAYASAIKDMMQFYKI